MYECFVLLLLLLVVVILLWFPVLGILVMFVASGRLKIMVVFPCSLVFVTIYNYSSISM